MMHEMLKWVNGMNYLNIEITLIINEQFFFARIELPQFTNQRY